MRKQQPQLMWEFVSHPDAEQRVAQAFDLLLGPLFGEESNKPIDSFLPNARGEVDKICRK